MASERSFQEHEEYFRIDGDLMLKQKCGSSAPTMAAEDPEGCFECSICLDSAHDPVVTLCGHLYCWPCIYEWLHVQESRPDSDQEQHYCPVCKANISYTSLVPLYGRGASSDSKAKKFHSDISVPPRPLPLGANMVVSSSPSAVSHSSQHLQPNLIQPQSQSFHHHEFFSHPYGSYAAAEPSGPRDINSTSLFNPYGEMVYARIFGSSDPPLFAYPYTNSYPFMTSSGNPRMRRQEMQLDKSLNRVSIFLFCCFMLCLLLF